MRASKLSIIPVASAEICQLSALVVEPALVSPEERSICRIMRVFWRQLNGGGVSANVKPVVEIQQPVQRIKSSRWPH